MKGFSTFILCIFLVGCELEYPKIKVVSKPTARSTQILSNPSGVKIEINDEYVGETPLCVEIKRTANDNTGGADCWKVTINAIPNRKGQYAQTKFFDYTKKIPSRIFFEMSQKPVDQRQQIDVNITHNSSDPPKNNRGLPPKPSSPPIQNPSPFGDKQSKT